MKPRFDQDQLSPNQNGFITLNRGATGWVLTQINISSKGELVWVKAHTLTAIWNRIKTR